MTIVQNKLFKTQIPKILYQFQKDVIQKTFLKLIFLKEKVFYKIMPNYLKKYDSKLKILLIFKSVFGKMVQCQLVYSITICEQFF